MGKIRIFLGCFHMIFTLFFRDFLRFFCEFFFPHFWWFSPISCEFSNQKRNFKPFLKFFLSRHLKSQGGGAVNHLQARPLRSHRNAPRRSRQSPRRTRRIPQSFGNRLRILHKTSGETFGEFRQLRAQNAGQRHLGARLSEGSKMAAAHAQNE